MKRLKRVVLLLAAMALLMSTTVFAATSSEALAQFQSELAAAGVPQQYIPSVVTQVTNHPVSQSDIDTLTAQMKDLETKIGNRTSIDQFTTTELKSFNAEAQSIAASYGLTFTIGSDLNSIVVSDAKTGATISSVDLAQLKTQVQGIDTAKLKEAIKTEMVYADAIAAEKKAGTQTNTDSNVIVATAMKHTATNNGNLLFAGFGLVTLAGLVYVVSKKRVLA